MLRGFAGPRVQRVYFFVLKVIPNLGPYTTKGTL